MWVGRSHAHTRTYIYTHAHARAHTQTLAHTHPTTPQPDLRCSVTTVIQDGEHAGQRDKNFEPLTTLRSTRKCCLFNGAAFGVKLNHIPPFSDGHGIICVGDRIKVLERLVAPASTFNMNLKELQVALLPNHMAVGSHL